MPTLSVEQKSLTKAVSQWWRQWTRRGSARFELKCCGEEEVERMAKDIGVFPSELRKLAQFGREHADIFSHALHFLLAAAFQFESCGTSSGPLSPPLRNGFGQAFLFNGQGRHLSLLLLQPMTWH